MRIAKHILLALSVLLGMGVQAQLTNQYLGGTSTAVINRGIFESDSALGFPKDTIMRSTWPKTKPHIAAIGDSLYLWSTATQSWRNLTRVAATASAAWGSITGSLSTQTDIRDSLNARERLLPFGTALQYFKGNKTLGTLSTDVRAFTDLLYMKYTDTTSLSNRINQIKSSSFSATNLVPHDGLYIDGNNIGVYNYNAQWDAKWLQKTLLSSVQPLDQQTLIYNAAKQQAEWGFLGATSNGTADGNNYLSNLYLDVDSLKASIVGMAGFTIDLSQRFVNKQLLQSYIIYVLDSTTKYFDSTYFTGAGTNLNPYTLKHGAIGSDSTIYKTDGSIAADRTIGIAGHTLSFQGDMTGDGNYVQIDPSHFLTSNTDGTNTTQINESPGQMQLWNYKSDQSETVLLQTTPEGFEVSHNGGSAFSRIGFDALGNMQFQSGNGAYTFLNLPTAPADVNSVVVYKDSSDGVNHYGTLTAKPISELGADGNNYVTGGNLTGGTLTLNRNGMADLAITGFNSNTGAPDDIDFTAGATGKPAAGASTITFNGSIGYKVRVTRGKVQQPTTDMGDSFYATKDINSETLSLGQPLVSGEHILVQFYKPSGTVTY